ncbi:MAG: FAD-dependent oxidoreductase [Victivallales bacterium]|nr:FAD-dependent oxidoreductase [Victivallales bacterium]
MVHVIRYSVLAVLGLVFALGATDLRTDVCVVGGGSGGIGAALAAAREGANVVLVEKLPVLGGTSAAGFVSLLSGPGDAFAREIYLELKRQGQAGVTRRFGKVPFHCWSIDPKLTYDSTLMFRGNRLAFDPATYSATVLGMLKKEGVQVLLNTTFTEAGTAGKRVQSIQAVAKDGTEYRIEAKVFVDATGDVYLCRAAGCETAIGPGLNGVTLCYRVRKGGEEHPDVPTARPIRRSSCNHQLPNGDRLINMLPTMDGDEFLKLGYEKALKTCRTRILRHWAFLSNGPGEWRDYRFVEAAPILGIREGYRIVGEYVLASKDLQQGILEQGHPDMIALASHAVDVHGANRKKVKHLKVKPYGIPYRCLIPKGWDNLLVACRGASFDRVAASSVRLSRTMLWLGHAAGVGAALAAKEDMAVGEVDAAKIRQRTGMDAESVRKLIARERHR